MATNPQSLADFIGIWQITRRIMDHKLDQVVTAQGRAVLSPTPEGVAYREDLVLTLPDQRQMNAQQRYQWRITDTGLAIAFEDGRPFHDLPLGADTVEVFHFCDPDCYRGSYGFENWPKWRLNWRVTGPKKDYTSQSDYRPQPG